VPCYCRMREGGTMNREVVRRYLAAQARAALHRGRDSHARTCKGGMVRVLPTSSFHHQPIRTAWTLPPYVGTTWLICAVRATDMHTRICGWNRARAHIHRKGPMCTHTTSNFRGRGQRAGARAVRRRTLPHHLPVPQPVARDRWRQSLLPGQTAEQGPLKSKAEV
jgi:hypothetical protein